MSEVRWVDCLWFLVAVVVSHVQAWNNRLRYRQRDVRVLAYARRHPFPDRRKNPRFCPTCGGPMRSDFRGPGDYRDPSGKIRTRKGDILKWFICIRCHGYQIGVMK